MHHITSETIPKSISKKIDVVVGLDARGFLLGPPLALRLGAAFAPARKQGKLPGKCVSATYEKEYGIVSHIPSYYVLLEDNVFRTYLRCKRTASRPAKAF